jgi:hypothetical protein
MKIVDGWPGVWWRGPSRIPAPTGQRKPAQGNALGIMPRISPRSHKTPQIVASPTRADTRTRTMRRPNDAALLQSASIPTNRVPNPYPPSNPHGCTLGWYAALLQSASIPTIRVPDACPPSNPQGCTLGWYAALLQSASIPTDRVSDACAASMTRVHTHQPCPGSIPTIQSPGLHPGLVCVAPLGQMEPGAHGSSA